MTDGSSGKGSGNNRPNRIPLQNHHFATNKHSKFTPEMESIARRYGLDLNGFWNKRVMPHLGRHPHAYHRWVLREMRLIDAMTNGNKEMFLRLFNERIIEHVLRNPDMLRKSFWH